MTVPTFSYVYRARCSRVTDGDTVELTISLGFQVQATIAIRLVGLNCPEKNTPAGKAAQVYTSAWMANRSTSDWPLLLASEKPLEDVHVDKYGGRWDGRIWRLSDGRCLNDDLTQDGHATAWDGKGHRP